MAAVALYDYPPLGVTVFPRLLKCLTDAIPLRLEGSCPQASSTRDQPHVGHAPAFVDPLADVPLLGPVTNRFTIQPGEITFAKVGSIEVVSYPLSEEGEAKPTTPPAGQPREARE